MAYDTMPVMVFFDVGGTLFAGGKFSAADGFAPLRAAAQNPDVTDEAELAALWDAFLSETAGQYSRSGVPLETPLSAVLRYAEMQTGLRVDLPMAQQEELFDRCNSARTVIDGVPELLSFLASRGVRTAVISNNMMSGEGLALAVRHWLPESAMEFCLTSADLLLTKPCPELFLAAARYAGVLPADCWYCGDSRTADVDGARSAGMTPVLLDGSLSQPYDFAADGGRAPYLIVRSWHALRVFLKQFFQNGKRLTPDAKKNRTARKTDGSSGPSGETCSRAAHGLQAVLF